jgi:beta-N-acetylhexosaminidase
MAAQSAVILGLEGPVLSKVEADFFRAANPYGFILFARNIETPQQLTALCADLRGCVGGDVPILIDQEGGRVQRMRAPHWREWLAPLDQGACAADPARAAYLRARIMAQELRSCGVDANCAPTCDIAGPLTHPFLRNRCWGETVAEVVSQARATMDGLLAGGVLPIVKHMPGHGRAVNDSHHDLPTVTATAQDLRETDFAVFHALRDAPMGMTAHIRFTAFDDAPATQSARMIQLIREDIGFGGLLMTDDIAMQALSGRIFERSAAAIAAGCDIVLHCNGKMAEAEEAVAASGALSAGALTRALAALDARKTPAPIDIVALDAELGSVLGQGSDG